ncbi:sigma 54-interacting transcriptional regulator [uncultured Psychroserpens sp.]|uniref:sigma 54-interacting transcriptional regulator n=1 Tax=uncultured Psychroserpens sp. TaxID=255436 RepID=UPI00262ABCF9|nr:sigma 54-interacting transcriptional regulator [uncultured Psychroserpens sp.]
MPELNLVNFLSKVSFFSEVSKKSLKNLVANSTEESFRKNEIIIAKETIGDAMYVIINGTVKVHDNDHQYDTLLQGECFGEYALIDNKKRSASVTTIERTKVLKIERIDFLNLMTEDGGFAQGILAVMIKRHRELDAIQERLARSKLELELESSRTTGLVQGAMDAIIMFDSNFRIVLTNPSANKLLENDDTLQRNVLYFFDEDSAEVIESLIDEAQHNKAKTINNYIPNIVKVIGSNETETLNEGTISKFGNETETFYTLILRNIEERLDAENQINFLTNQTEYLNKEIKELTSGYGIIAEDVKMQNVLSLIKHVAPTDATVLINGETGTGKELVSRAIHEASNRNDKPLIRINCGAIPANLIESELFGHKKGAFTGATADRKGRFLLADQGTIFLDEIGEMPIDLQPKLLRVIQEGEFDPVGSSETVKVNVRIIAATHRDLLQHANDGKFREDLYYRLNVFPIEVPALRDRGNDISLIANEMIRHFSKKLNKNIVDLTEADKSLLMSYQWPGNVRELQNLIERAIIISKDDRINIKEVIPNDMSFSNAQQDPIREKIYTSKELSNLEKENILKALKQTRWKISGTHGAAELLQLPATTLASKIKAFGLERPI